MVFSSLIILLTPSFKVAFNSSTQQFILYEQGKKEIYCCFSLQHWAMIQPRVTFAKKVYHGCCSLWSAGLNTCIGSSYLPAIRMPPGCIMDAISDSHNIDALPSVLFCLYYRGSNYKTNWIGAAVVSDWHFNNRPLFIFAHFIRRHDDDLQKNGSSYCQLDDNGGRSVKVNI